MIQRIAKEAEGQPANEALLIERVELANPKPDPNVKNQAGEQSLLPHERDQTTGRQGTSLVNEDERSRAVIGQAAEDTKRVLKIQSGGEYLPILLLRRPTVQMPLKELVISDEIIHVCPNLGRGALHYQLTLDI